MSLICKSRCPISNNFMYFLETLFSGLDIPKHNEPAYPMEAYGHGHIENIVQVLDNAGPLKVKQGSWYKTCTKLDPNYMCRHWELTTHRWLNE